MTSTNDACNGLRHLELDQQLAQRVHDSVSSTLRAMFGVTTTFQPFEISKTLDSVGNITGMVNIKQGTTDGAFLISFPRKTLAGLLKILYRADLEHNDSKLRLGAGELTNVIYSALKTGFNSDGFSFKMALPSVTMSQSRIEFRCPAAQVMRIAVRTEVGLFYVVVSQGCEPKTLLAA